MTILEVVGIALLGGAATTAILLAVIRGGSE